MGKHVKSTDTHTEFDHPLAEAMRQIADDIRRFIDLSLEHPDSSWEEWLPMTMKASDVKCWEHKGCQKKSCPAYENSDNRCWLIAGTMCGGVVQGEFAKKYDNCTECDVYKAAVFRDPASEIYEQLITLLHSLKVTQNKLKTMATRDILTGLYNRNYFNEVIVRDIERAKRNNERLSIIMIDVDNFKKINDTYGHLHGDGILKECAAILRKAVRKSDMLCRFGGDEFIIVTPSRGCGENEALVARIRSLLDKWNSEYASFDYTLSMSIGCSIWEPGSDIVDVMHDADQAMYRNKQKSRNGTGGDDR